jgi:hypothetical protein
LQVKPLIQDEKTNEKPYHEEFKNSNMTIDGDEKSITSSPIKVLRDGDLSQSDNNSVNTGFTSKGSRPGGGMNSFQSNNRTSYNNTSFNTSINKSMNMNDSKKTSFSNGKVSFNAT